MTKYAIVDTANLFFRARHVTRGDAFTKAGMTLHIIFNSLRKLFKEQQCEHIVLCLEGGSWRYKIFPQYKAKRNADRKLHQSQQTRQEKEEDEVFSAIYDDFVEFMNEKTRATILQSQSVEGDDFIARWIQLHPNDEHVILSSDSDFIQLLAPNVSIFNGMENVLITTKGVFNSETNEELTFAVDTSKGKIKIGLPIPKAEKLHNEEQKTKEKEHFVKQREAKKVFDAKEKEKKLDDPDYKPKPFVATPYDWEEFKFEIEEEWWRKALFIKCIRGDVGDGIFSAYPGVRYNGSKGKNAKPSISEAWENRNEKDFHYNNFMLQPWEKLVKTEVNGDKVTAKTTVLKEYEFNEKLIDLTKQPEEIKNLMDTVIVEAVQKEPVGNVGIHFMRFCDKHELVSLSRDAFDHAKYLNAGYK